MANILNEGLIYLMKKYYYFRFFAVVGWKLVERTQSFTSLSTNEIYLQYVYWDLLPRLQP